MTNSSDFTTTNQNSFSVNETDNIYPNNSNDIDVSCLDDTTWYSKGCYRKQVKANKFRATKSLKLDLECLFLKGFDDHGLKKGKNKYTPQQARTYLQNMEMENGRRKYSSQNVHGPLPSKEYIQGWFSRRKAKMAKLERERANRLEVQENINEEEHQPNVIVETAENNGEFYENELYIPTTTQEYSKASIDELKKAAANLMEDNNLTVKGLYRKLLLDDDVICARGNKEQNHTSIVKCTVKELREICENRMLMKSAPNGMTKSLLITFLTRNDIAEDLRVSMNNIDPIIQKHQAKEKRQTK